MDRDELARRIRENIFERCSDEGHASKEVIERAIIDSLGKHLIKDSIRDVYTLTEAQPACSTVQQIKSQIMPMPFNDVSQGVEALADLVRGAAQKPWPVLYRGMGLEVTSPHNYWTKG